MRWLEDERQLAPQLPSRSVVGGESVVEALQLNIDWKLAEPEDLAMPPPIGRVHSSPPVSQFAVTMGDETAYQP